MGEVINASFGSPERDSQFDCPAFPEPMVPCVSLWETDTEGGKLIRSEQFDETVAICAASQGIAEELSSPAACGYQKYTMGTNEEQVRIRSIVEGVSHA